MDGFSICPNGLYFKFLVSVYFFNDKCLSLGNTEDYLIILIVGYLYAAYVRGDSGSVLLKT